jgi:predicted Zn finger-like uncharacterized protein
MSMFTTCPNCKLHLAVTAVDLRIGQGYVRCGRCDRVFNALLSLGEDPDREHQTGLMATGTLTLPALENTDDAILTDVRALEPTAEPGIPPPAEPEDFSSPDEWSKVSPIRPQLHEDEEFEFEVEEQMATGTFETIVLEGDTILQTEEHVDETEVDAQIQQIADRIGNDNLAYDRDAVRGSDDVQVEELDTGEVPLDGAGAQLDAAATEVREIDADEAVGNTPALHWGWKAAAAMLLLLLLGQLAHHHRQELVAKAWAERPLRSVYALFGVVLEPHWDLKAYDLRQLGGEAQPGDAAKIVLRATVQNRAAIGQPPPMIRVTLQDRFGNALSTTAIAPQDYLRGAAPSRIAADQRLDAQLTLDDPNRQAVGFELDACLPDAAGSLHCSTDP